MRAIRPGLGFPAKSYDVVIGKKLTRDVARGTAVSWLLFY